MKLLEVKKKKWKKIKVAKRKKKKNEVVLVHPNLVNNT